MKKQEDAQAGKNAKNRQQKKQIKQKSEDGNMSILKKEKGCTGN